jgi:hypothetical protein
MESNKTSYIKTDENKVINEKYIRWIAIKMDECLAVCMKSDGCEPDNTHKVCKINNPSSYSKLKKLIE